MIEVIKRFPVPLLALIIAASTSLAIIACDPQSGQPESGEFTADESYLIDSYVRVKYAQGHYPRDPAAAESLFADLTATVDTVRIARTIAALNRLPDRWASVYREIEERMREAARESDLERSRAGAGAPAQVEQNDERH